MSEKDFHKAWVDTLCIKCLQAQKEMMPDKIKPTKFYKQGLNRYSICYPTVYHPSNLCYYCRKKQEGLI